MKKRLLALLLGVCVISSAVLSAGCGSKADKSDKADKKEKAEKATEAEEDEDDKITKVSLFEAKDKGEGSDADTPAGTKMVITSNKMECHMDGTLQSEATYPLIELSSEAKEDYPELASTLNERNKAWKDMAAENCGSYAPWCADMRKSVDYDFETFYYNCVAELKTFDDGLCTILANYGDFSGGVHPNSWTESIHLSPVTGKQIKLRSVLEDDTGFTDIIYDELLKQNPGRDLETVDDVKENIDSIYEDSEYTWFLDEEGLNLIFDPYEIAYYALGRMDVTLSYEDYPNLIKDRFKIKEKQDVSALVVYKDAAETEEVEPIYEEGYEGSDAQLVKNPTWKRYAKDGLIPTHTLVQLDKSYEKSTDWLNSDAWIQDYGFENENLTLPYSDGTYYYEPYDYRDYEYMYQCIRVRDGSAEGSILYDYDLSEICNGPDEEKSKYSATTQYVRFAKLLNGVLYVSVLHNGYSSEEKEASSVVAIDVTTGEVIWRSDPLVCNSDNFVIVNDEALICGYGFTDEPDYIYVLDLGDGSIYKQIPVKTAAYYFVVRGNKLHVCTYNTDYIFDISFG